MKWLLIDRQQYSENTSEYGYGDYPVYNDYILLVVEADTRRKAQYAAKQIIPNLQFGGMFSVSVIEANPFSIARHREISPKLHGKAYERHRQALKNLEVV